MFSLASSMASSVASGAANRARRAYTAVAAVPAAVTSRVSSMMDDFKGSTYDERLKSFIAGVVALIGKTTNNTIKVFSNGETTNFANTMARRLGSMVGNNPNTSLLEVSVDPTTGQPTFVASFIQPGKGGSFTVTFKNMEEFSQQYNSAAAAAALEKEASLAKAAAVASGGKRSTRKNRSF
jgi:hypothetical protein